MNDARQQRLAELVQARDRLNQRIVRMARPNNAAAEARAAAEAHRMLAAARWADTPRVCANRRAVLDRPRRRTA